MTDRHAGYIVTLEQDIRADDAEPTRAAIQQIRGVLSVTPFVGNVELVIAQQRAMHELRTKVFDFFQDLMGRKAST